MPGPQRAFRRLVRTATAHPFATVLAVGLAVRVAVALAVYAKGGGTLFNDDARYNLATSQWAEGPPRHWEYSQYFRDFWPFLYPVAVAKRVVGTSVLTGQLVVAVTGSLVAVATAAVARLVVPARWALAAGLVVACYPSQVLWSSLVLRDATVWALMATLSLVVGLAVTRPQLRWWLWGPAVLVLLVGLEGARAHIFVVACWALVLASVAVAGKALVPRTAAALVVALLLPLGLGHEVGGRELVFQSYANRRALNAIDADTAVVDPVITPSQALAEAEVARRRAESAASAARTDAERAGAARLAREAERARRKAGRLSGLNQVVIDSAFGVEPVDSSAGSNVKYLPHGVALMLLRPFVWQSTHGNSNLTLALAENVLWYPLLLLAALGVVVGWSRRKVLVLPLALGLGSMLASALTEGNFGTAYRHRSEFVWVVALLAAVGATWLAGRRRGTEVTGVEEVDVDARGDAALAGAPR